MIVGARYIVPLRVPQAPKNLADPQLVHCPPYKAAVTRRIGRELNATGIWQRNYYEQIIRDEKGLRNKTDYIYANPSLWYEDDNNPGNYPSL